MTQFLEGNKTLIERDHKGRFVPGQSGNPAGRAKGLKNYITHERRMLELALREYVADPNQATKLLKGITRVLDIANDSKTKDKDAISAMKLLLDRVMPAMPEKEQEDAQKADKRLQVIIQTNPDAVVAVETVIEGKVIEEITDE